VGGILLLAVICSLGFNRELTHDGRTVTEWSLDLLNPVNPARSNATLALRSIGPEAVPALGRQLRQRDSWLRVPFMEVSSHLPVKWRRTFIRYCQPFRPINERRAAVIALELFGTNVPAELFLETLRDADRQLANQAASALVHYGPGAVPGLTLALQDSNPEVRQLACSTLSQIGRPAASAAPQLVVSLSDPQIMAMAAYALTRIGPHAVPYLAQALEHPQPRVREKAAVALGQLGPSARSAAPGLERLLEDEDPAVRKQGGTALRAVASRRHDEFGARHPSHDF
jgi:HEAT repeat protein